MNRWEKGARMVKNLIQICSRFGVFGFIVSTVMCLIRWAIWSITMELAVRTIVTTTLIAFIIPIILVIGLYTAGYINGRKDGKNGKRRKRK